MASLRILHLEDNEVDGEFVRLSLEEADLESEITRVETRDAFLSQLHLRPFDLIVSDFSLPSFDGLSALRLVREKKLDTIFVSGTIGEERPVVSTAGDGRLLVVLDEGSIREIARQTLEACGYRVLCPAGPDELARVLDERGSEIAAAVVNVSLPDLDADALVADLAKRAPAAKIIATTRTLEVPPKEGRAVAATLRQPYSPQKLLDTVGRVLQTRE